jgi:hypothetical protein
MTKAGRKRAGPNAHRRAEKRPTSVPGRRGNPDQGGGDRRVAAGDILIKREAPSMRPTMLQAPARSRLGKRLGVQLAGAGVEKIEHCVVVRPVWDRPPHALL